MDISIHALREEGDEREVKPYERQYISIHALREEGDWMAVPRFAALFRFLSTPSARRATKDIRLLHRGFADFYPRPPRGGRRQPAERRSPLRRFLSTPSARRATHSAGRSPCPHPDFYPRPPRGGRRFLPGKFFTGLRISIHALREEGDSSPPSLVSRSRIFLSTPSARRATSGTMGGTITALFLSTPSARRATIVAIQVM